MKPSFFTERGQALIILAFAAIGLFGIVGLVIDGGKKFSDQRHAQNAADTAALAAAFAKVTGLEAGDSNTPSQCPPSSGTPSTVCAALLSAGYSRATSNGYNGNLVTNTVAIYSPPISGPYSGKDNYVQAIITSYVKTAFARVLGIAQTQNIVQATVFIREGGDLANGAMLISYDPNPNCSTGGTGGYSVSVSGSSTVNLNGGGIFLNSQGTCGFVIPNCADLNIYGGGISSAGNNIDTGSCAFDPPITPSVNQDRIVIPDDVFWPAVPPECSMSGSPTPYKFPTQILGSDNKLHDQWLIYPGFYTDFPQPVLVTNKSYIYMASGVYCIDPPGTQDLSWSTVVAASLNGSTDPSINPYSAYNPDGVTLYIKAGGGFAINANSPTYLDATTTGDYQGYLIILEGTQTSHPTCTINGGATIDINGMIFAPYCNFTINGKAGETAKINAQLLGWDLKVNGANAVSFNFDPSNRVIIKSQIGLMR
jgi:Putative Flp pilus-assembly TadE/G-like